MGQKITRRKIRGVVFAAVLAFLAISCSNYKSPDDIPAAESSDGTDGNSPGAIPFTEEEMQEIYCSIKTAIETKYLEPNQIPPGSFQWPKYEVMANGIIRDEGHAWSYFNNIALNYSLSGTLYDTKGFLYELPQEPIRQLMDAVLDGLVDWSGRQEGESGAFQKAREAIFPEYENLPKHIDFLSPAAKLARQAKVSPGQRIA